MIWRKLVAVIFSKPLKVRRKRRRGITAAELRVQCPWCGALAGEVCRTTKNNITAKPHKQRHKLHRSNRNVRTPRDT